MVIDGTKKRVGKVQSEFVDDSLRNDDVFVLGSTAWRVTGRRRNQLMVKQAPGASPTVPWWMGPIPPRTAATGARVGLLRRDVAARLDATTLLAWISERYSVSEEAAVAVADYVREQHACAGMVPDHEHLLIESWTDELGRLNALVYCPLGQRINRTWGLALAALAKRSWGHEWAPTASNDLVLLTYHGPDTPVKRPDVEALVRALTSADLGDLIDTVAADAVSSGTAFRDVAATALQIRRYQRGQHVPLWLQNYRAEELYEAANRAMAYPVFTELRRSYVTESLDLAGLTDLLNRVEDGTMRLTFRDADAPSAFAHAFLVQDFYRADHQMGRERRAHLLRLHRQVLEQVLSAEQMAELLDDRAIAALEKRVTHTSEKSRARNADELAAAIRDVGDVRASIDAVAPMVEADAPKLLQALVRSRRVVAVRLPGLDDHAERLVAADLWAEYRDAFSTPTDRRSLQLLLPRFHGGKITTFDETRADVIPARWRRKTDRNEARRRIVERYLRCRGPVTGYELANHTGWPIRVVETLLDASTAEGLAAKGVYTAHKPRPQYISKANLEEIHRATMRYLRKELAACAPYEVVDFMTRWQHVHPETRLQGIDGLRQVIRQFQGYETVTVALESEVLAGRVRDYRPEMLDRLIGAGEVEWRRVGVRVSRGRVTLAMREDTEWLARGRAVEFDPEDAADEDIRSDILRVREYLREHNTTYFDPMVTNLGIDASVALRAIWCLAWFGEVSCDTYECLRHSEFTVAMSACYDLDSTPRTIVIGGVSSDRVIKQMKRRKLDPRLGRWWATERLAPRSAPDESATRCRWVDQLLRRWGIVTRDILAAECAAPAWGDLLEEFTRRELLGEVQRGYFIESHQGVQFGLPQAIELLRDCRARRAEGELGYLPDEPVFCLSNRDPANLYASSLDIIDERGEIFARTARQGNFIYLTVIQAGQALLCGDKQIVTLARNALLKCVQSQLRDAGGKDRKIRMFNWNDYPVDVSPIAPVLWDAGFRFNTRREMVFPPPKRPALERPTDDGRREFFPYYSEPPPVTYGRAWTVSRAPETLAHAVDEMLGVLTTEFSRRDWEVSWGSDGLKAAFPGKATVFFRSAKTYAMLHINARPGIIDGTKHHLVMWKAYPGMLVARIEDVAEFAERLPELLDIAEICSQQYLKRKGEF